MWNTLENQSIVLVSERRIGKTSVIRKMEKEPREGWYPIYLVVEGVRSPTEFVSKIVNAVSPILSQKNRVLNRLNQVYQEIAGQKVGNWEMPELKNNWKRLLQTALNDIRDNFDERVVFLWDELPLMVSNIKEDLGVKTAMELLDVLRDHRLTDDSGKLRMVYTGSIGLHLVVSELLHRGYRNDPTNDMVTYPLEGLEPEHARELACQDLQGLIDEGEIELRDPLEDMVQAIATAVDGLPYYISYTVVRLSEMDQPVTTTDIPIAIDSLILDPEDTAHFRHYAERIEAYYLFHEKARPLAYAILNALCHIDQWMVEEAIWEAAVAQLELTDRNFFLSVLEMLVNDHYLNRTLQEKERIYRFKYNIIKKWWLKNRG
jgi:hypothetical protein